MNVADVARDLTDEQQALDDLVAGLTPQQWDAPTPSPRWSVTDQIGHLAYFDGTAALAITDPEAFQETTAALLHSIGTGDETAGDDYTLGAFRALTPAERLAQWRAKRQGLAAAAATLAEDARIPWYGPDMGAKSFLTARLMEAWAHGQDVADAVGATLPATDRLRHIAQIGFITRGWTYANRGLDTPAGTVALALTAPDGSVWTFGPDDADDTVTGTALDFCLVVTQRRHLDDTALTGGPLARDWLEKAQAFAGPPSDGPAPTPTTTPSTTS